MGSKDRDFLGKLKNAWDLYFSNNPELILILCGSISSWIEENILSSTGYLGRVTLDLVLEELPLSACQAFWAPHENRISAYEKFKILSVTGGVPLYLELLHPERSAEENIREMCFTRGGLLVREFEQIFSDLFSNRSRSYKEIVECLATGPKELPEICHALQKSKRGTYNKYLEDLVKAGYIKRDFTWHLKTGKQGKLSRYRLSDNYLRFHLKYMAPQQFKIENGLFDFPSLSSLPAWELCMGMQFENLVVHNRRTLWNLLRIAPSDIIMEGPFFQSATQTQPGCQIDYLVQTRFNTLYLCEIKFYKNSLAIKVIEEVEKKIDRLVIPKYYSIRPILIHVNGIEESVLDRRYFDQVIDFSQLLQS